MLQDNFVATIEASIKTHWEQPALSDYRGETATYQQVADRILYLHHVFQKAHIKKGDKISLVGKNSKNWAIVYLATVSYGAIIVPIMPDFPASDIQHIVNHSDSVLLFAAEAIYDRLDPEHMDDLEGILSIDRFSVLHAKKKSLQGIVTGARKEYLEKYKNGLTPDTLAFTKIDNNKLAAIIYTSGTTGFSKGVMLPHNSLMGNVKFARENLDLHSGDVIVSFLPVAHCYGCAFDFLFPFSVGAHIHFLGKIPSPRVLTEAFQQLSPRFIFSVPLVLEKIYKKKIKAKLGKGVIKILMALPGVKGAILNKIRKSIMEAFGGRLEQLVIGGAALNQEVEVFFKKINFPITVGYGMTECGPLISYSPYDAHKAFSIGKELAGLMEVRIDSPDPANVVGEILTRGENLMEGYYRNKKATQQAIDKDGWLHTGDLGLKDAEGFIYIKGRSKSMLLGPAGENIYPEEIESRLNNLPFIQESLVVQRDSRLVALVYPDMELVDSQNIEENELQAILEDNRKQINEQLPAYSKIARFELYPEEFEKTPKKSIKRFLYTSPGPEPAVGNR